MDVPFIPSPPLISDASQKMKDAVADCGVGDTARATATRGNFFEFEAQRFLKRKRRHERDHKTLGGSRIFITQICGRNHKILG
jgi:hypothetical protein